VAVPKWPEKVDTRRTDGCARFKTMNVIAGAHDPQFLRERSSVFPVCELIIWTLIVSNL